MRIKDLIEYPKLKKIISKPVEFMNARRNPPKQPHYDLQLSDGKILKLRSGTRDFHTFHRVFIRDEYKLSSIGRLNTVIDVGAHIGLFTMMVSRICHKVYSIEPASDNFELLSYNTGSLGDKAVICKMAVTDKLGEIDLFKSGDPYGYTCCGQGDSAIKERVTTTTLAELLSSNGIVECDLLKLDCEGAEYGILFSSSGETLNKIRRIYMEYHDVGGNYVKLSKFLAEQGYTVNVISHRKKSNKGHIFCVRK